MNVPTFFFIKGNNVEFANSTCFCGTYLAAAKTVDQHICNIIGESYKTNSITVHQDSMYVCFIPPYTPLLYSIKLGVTGVYIIFLFLL